MSYPQYIARKESETTKERVLISITGAYSFVKVVVSPTHNSATSINDKHHKVKSLFYAKGYGTKSELKKEYVSITEQEFMLAFGKALIALNIDVKKIRKEKQGTPKEHEA